MTDRELLELAYRAYAPGENYIRMVNVAGVDYWNPLTDSGQALELAVKLSMDIRFYPEGETPWVETAADSGYADEALTTDPLAATRRAIVRAAAEIGRSMK